ncbi:MAG: YhbY family RNA-binding protein [Christensenellales bacterium]
MLTSKERAYLRGVASTQEAVCFVGKDGLGEMCLASINDALTARELVKISVLQNCDCDTKSVANEICEKLECECVGIVGRKIVVYKHNPENKNHVLKLKI